jgi:hypothetical protein
VGIDRPDDADMPSGDRSDHSADRTPAAGDGGGQSDKIQGETRDRQEYYADLRAEAAVEEQTEPAGRSEPGARSKAGERSNPEERPNTEERPKAGEPAENGQQAKAAASWEETAELGRWMWGEYKRRWPPEERPPVDRSDDPPGSWRGDRVRFLPTAVNAELEQECDRIADREEKTISPKMREVEGCDPDRQLVGFDHCRKGRDRIKEKVYDNITLKHHSPREAISLLSDTIRYTFEYDYARYTQGVRADIVQMKEQGFELDVLKNSWSGDQYKGINSQWIEPATGQRFELQFHTRISFEAKQITHNAYERLRTKQADAFEELVLGAFQEKVTASVPIPPGAAAIPDYPEREQDAR